MSCVLGYHLIFSIFKMKSPSSWSRIREELSSRGRIQSSLICLKTHKQENLWKVNADGLLSGSALTLRDFGGQNYLTRPFLAQTLK